MYVTGRHILRGAGESPAANAARFYSCPWGLVQALRSTLDAARRVADGLTTLADYVGGRPSIAVYEALEIIAAERPVALRVLRAETEGTP